MEKIEFATFDAAEYIRDETDIAAYLNASLDDIDMLPVALRTIVRARGVNKIAEETGIPHKTLYRALNGDSEIKLSLLHKLSAVLGVNLRFSNASEAEEQVAA